MKRPALVRAKHCLPLALPFMLTSCFTMMVWGFLPASDVDPVTGADETGFEYMTETRWSWGLFFGRLGLTPFTLVLDCLTCPVQAIWFGWPDDDCPK